MRYDYKQFEAACLQDVSLWTRAHNAGAQISPDFMTITTSIRVKGLKDLNAWPWWAKALKIVAQASRLFGPNHTGAGDTLEWIIKWTGLKLLARRKNCTRCQQSQATLNTRYPYILLIIVALCCCAAPFSFGATSAFDPFIEAQTWPSIPPTPPKIPDLSPAHAAKAMVIQPDQSITTNSVLVVPTYPANAAYLIIYDGTNSGSYNESNVVATVGGTLSNYLLTTTNPTPFVINARSQDTYGNVSDLGNEIWFYGWTSYAPTNWTYITNPSGSPVMMGPDPSHQTIPTNFLIAILTNDITPKWFYSVPAPEILTILHFTTTLRTNIPPGTAPAMP